MRIVRVREQCAGSEGRHRVPPASSGVKRNVSAETQVGKAAVEENASREITPAAARPGAFRRYETDVQEPDIP